MPKLDRSVLAVSAALLLVLVGLQLHGYSLAAWHDWVGSPSRGGVLIGSARTIRVDDYAVMLPLALAQEAHDPPFPVFNENIGMGENMLAPLPVPVFHPVTIFRPSEWGFFVGPEIGISWRWWFLTLGLFVVWHHVFVVVAGGQRLLAGMGAALLVFSPFVQFWSLVPASAALATGSGILAAIALFYARSTGRAIAAGIWLGWSGASLVLTLYLPFVVPMAYLGAVLVCALLLEGPRSAGRWAPRLAGAVVACAVAGLGIAALLHGAGELIDRIQETAYPGGRIATGGDRPLWALLGANFDFAWSVRDFGGLRNICEAASFWLFSPVAGVVILWRAWRTRQRPDGVSIALLGFCVVSIAYCSVGVPEWLARATQLSRSPGIRVVMAVGFADALLLLRLLSLAPVGPLVGKRDAGAIAAGFVILLAACAPALRRAVPEIDLLHIGGMLIVNGFLAYALARRTRPAVFLCGLLLITAASTMWFNPVARGGVRELRELPISRAILKADHDAGGKSVWLAYADPVTSNLFRVLGVRCLNGIHPAPQFSLWDRIDPSEKSRFVYNRYAQVILRTRRATGARLSMLRADGSHACSGTHETTTEVRERIRIAVDLLERRTAPVSLPVSGVAPHPGRPREAHSRTSDTEPCRVSESCFLERDRLRSSAQESVSIRCAPAMRSWIGMPTRQVPTQGAEQDAQTDAFSSSCAYRRIPSFSQP
jgi:hypothetical protein